MRLRLYRTRVALAAISIICFFGFHGSDLLAEAKDVDNVAYYFLFDVSRSMPSDGWSKSFEPIEELVLNETITGDRILVIAFGTNSILVDSCTRSVVGDVSELFDVAKGNIMEIIDANGPGETWFKEYTVFEAAINRMFVVDYLGRKPGPDDHRKRVVCLVTDGKPDSYWTDHLVTAPLARIDSIIRRLPGPMGNWRIFAFGMDSKAVPENSKDIFTVHEEITPARITQMTTEIGKWRKTVSLSKELVELPEFVLFFSVVSLLGLVTGFISVWINAALYYRWREISAKSGGPIT